MEAFVGIISDKLGSFFDLTFHNICPNKRPPIFGELGAVTVVGLWFSGGWGWKKGHRTWSPDAEDP